MYLTLAGELAKSRWKTQLQTSLGTRSLLPNANVRQPIKFVSHSFRAASIAARFGWLPGARYTNLRDARRFDRLGFLDIDWKNYNFARHLEAARSTRPLLTVARDLERIEDVDRIVDQGNELLGYCDNVIMVPKDHRFEQKIEELIPKQFVLGFSVPTKYGGTRLAPREFRREVHLLGGRPDVQRALARELCVASLDCNRFTLDAAYGDYFDGQIFRPHPTGGYVKCLEDSVANINRLWEGYNG